MIEPKFKYRGLIMGKPRLTQRDRWKKRPVVQRYYAFKDELKLKAKVAGFELGEEISCTVFIEMPKSWSKKKRLQMLGTPHKQRADLDNIIKAVQDILLLEDSSVHTYKNVSKVWAEFSGIDFY